VSHAATETHAILVMDDGETWSGVDGASICIITDRQYNELIDGTTQLEDLGPIFELGLRDYTLLQPKGNR
jgi:hypothetical protein